MKRRDLMGGAAAFAYVQTTGGVKRLETSGGHLLYSGSPPAVISGPATTPVTPFTGVARTLYNHSVVAAPLGTPVIMLASFGPGELASRGSVVPTFNGVPLAAGRYQQGPFSTHPDGSLHEGTLTVLAPAAIPAGDGITAGLLGGLVLTTSSSAPATATPITLAQIQARMAAADIRVDLTGCDLGATVYRVSCADVLGNFQAYPWGTSNPLGGYRVVEAGPFPLIEVWRFLKNTTTGASHAWAKARFFVRFFSASAGGPALIGNPILENDNCYGPVSSTADFATGNGRPRVIAGSVTVYEGSSVVLQHGGPADPRAILTTAGDLVGASNTLGGALRAGMGADSGIGWTITGPGVASGLVAAAAYWPIQIGSTTMLATDRQAAQNSEPGAWAASTAYANPTVVVANGALYRCLTNGTSATSGTGPSGGGNVSDGSVTWTCCSALFGAAGSGAVTASPVVHISQRGHQRLGLLSGAPAWVGTGFDVIAGHDLPHLFRVSRSTPAYDPAAVAALVPATTPLSFTPGMAPNWGWNLDNTGNGFADDRIGPINHTGIQAIYRPQDTVAATTARSVALQFSDFPFNWTDERDGLPIVLNNGPAKDGVAYPGRAAPNPGFQTGNGPGYGSPGLLVESGLFRDQDAGQYQSNYSRYHDFSHQARSWRPAWLLTGDTSHLIIARQQANAAAGLLYARTQSTGGVTYYACYIDNNQQRDAAWSLAAHGDAVAALPVGDPVRVYLLDMLDDASGWLNAIYTTAHAAGSNAAAWGMIQGSTEYPTAIPPWEVFMLMIHVLQEKWRGNAPGFGTFWDGYLRNYTKIFNPKHGGWISASGAYCISACSGAANAGGLSISDLQTTWTTIAQMYQGPNTDNGVGSHAGSGGVLPAEPSAAAEGGPFLGYDPAAQRDFVTYAMIFLAMTQQMAVAGDPDGAALLAATRARFGQTAPFTFTHPNSGSPINVLQFALAA